MATITSKEMIDQLIANGGRYQDDPPVARIVEYQNFNGETCWGVVWVGESVSINRYMRESEYINNPRIIWQHPDLPAEPGQAVDVAQQCDSCKGELKGKAYDAVAPAFGQWGWLCHKCFRFHGCSIGPGRGQEYTQQEDGRWLKTGG